MLIEDEGVYVAMGGLKKGTIERLKKEYPQEIFAYHLCVDWDNAGNEFACNYPDMNRIVGNIGKDWNDELRALKSMQVK